MKARDLRDRSTEDLAELERSLSGDSFQSRFKNFTNRLDDTSVIQKNRRDLARVKLILSERARGVSVVYKTPEASPAKPKTRPAKGAPKEIAESPQDAEASEAADKKESAAKKKPAAKAAAKPTTTAKATKAAPHEKVPAAKKPKPKTEKGSK